MGKQLAERDWVKYIKVKNFSWGRSDSEAAKFSALVAPISVYDRLSAKVNTFYLPILMNASSQYSENSLQLIEALQEEPIEDQAFELLKKHFSELESMKNSKQLAAAHALLFKRYIENRKKPI